MESPWKVEPMRREHISDVVALQRLCFPPPFPSVLLWNAGHLENHLQIFPGGQFVALDGDRVIGSASAILTYPEEWVDYTDWESLTGGLSFSHHNPDGTVVFGADISIHPDFRRRGVARSLYRARFEFVRRHDLAGFTTACRMPDFAASGISSTLDYGVAVAEGRRADRTLTPLLRIGMEFTGVQDDVMDDSESGNAAALLEWRP